MASTHASSLAEPPLTCLVVADHQLCGQAVGGLLSEQCGLELVAVCPSVAEAVGVMTGDGAPGLLLLDADEPEECWQEAARLLLRLNPKGRLIMLTAEGEPLVANAELAPALLGVVSKSCPWEDLISLVISWQQQNPSAAYRRSATALRQLNRLSPRELRVFHALGRGKQNKEIAKLFGLRLNTVETYRKTISAKLGLSGMELVRTAALHRCTNAVFSSPRL